MANPDENENNTNGDTIPPKLDDIVKGPEFVLIQNSDQSLKPFNVSDKLDAK